MKTLLKKIIVLLIRLWQIVAAVPYRSLAGRLLRWIGRRLHWLLFEVLLPKRLQGATKRDIYTVIFRSDTPAGKKFDIWLLVLIGLNIVVLIMDSFQTIHEGTFSFWLVKLLEWGFTLLFTFEFYLRCYCLKRPMAYVLSFYGMIDVLSIFPAYLSLFIPATQALTVLRLMRLLRVFRIFKMESFLQESRMLMNSLKRSMTKILIFMLFVFIVAIILGALLYSVEGEKNPQISTIPEGIYWAVVTLTTVGYGDVTPVTPLGRFIAIVVMILGYSIIAVPTGIVAGETIEEHRHPTPKRKERTFEPQDDNHRDSWLT